MGDSPGSGDFLATAAHEMLAPLKDIILKIAGPLASEIGLGLGDAARVYRFKRAVQLLEKVKRIASDAGFEPRAVSPRLLLPILDASSLEDNDDLHDHWAALLANAANPGTSQSVHAAFIEILKTLSTDDVDFFGPDVRKSARSWHKYQR